MKLYRSNGKGLAGLPGWECVIYTDNEVGFDMPQTTPELIYYMQRMIKGVYCGVGFFQKNEGEFERAVNGYLLSLVARGILRKYGLLWALDLAKMEKMGIGIGMVGIGT